MANSGGIEAHLGLRARRRRGLLPQHQQQHPECSREKKVGCHAHQGGPTATLPASQAHVNRD